MSYQISPFVIPTFLAGEFISQVNIITPALILHRPSLASALLNLSVLISRCISPTRASLPRYYANFGSCFKCVFFANSIGWSLLSRFAHFPTRFLAHLFPLHWRNKIRMTKLPHFPHLLFGFLSVFSAKERVVFPLIIYLIWFVFGFLSSYHI